MTELHWQKLHNLKTLLAISVLGPGNLLLRDVNESFQLRKHRLYFLYALQSLGFVMQLLGQRQDFYYEGSSLWMSFSTLLWSKLKRTPVRVEVM